MCGAGETQKDYYDCVKDRTISIVWACRDQANAMNECLHQHTTDEVLEDLKYRWVKAGSRASRTERRCRSFSSIAGVQ